MSKEPARRKISKSVRFEVFKRDSFKCQYCGASAPDVLLHIDHIQPVSKGGTNDILNLLTACAECNNGKSNKPLSDKTVLAKKKQQLDDLQLRREQLEMMMDWHKGLSSIESDTINHALDAWEVIAKGYELTDAGKMKLKKHLKKFSLAEVLEGMETAATNYFIPDGDKYTAESVEEAFSKVGAICNVNRQVKDKPELKEFYYIRAILRNRVKWIDEKDALERIEGSVSWGATIEEIKQVAKNATSWDNFIDRILELNERCQREERT